MARFSERIGATPPKAVLQLTSMDGELRNGLWNACYGAGLGQLTTTGDLRQDRILHALAITLWKDHFKRPLDSLPLIGIMAFNEIKTRFGEYDWAGVYDFVEFFLQSPLVLTPENFVEECNLVLAKEYSAYRVLGWEIVPISNAQEIAAIEEASELGAPFGAVRIHIDSAIALFSDRKAPEYRNSIKESISAVEATCKIITGEDKGTLGQALKKLENKGITLHKALQNSFNSLYGYTSDADGIRHALLEESTLDFDDAKFMLVSCSAFVNYLAAKASKAGVIAAK